MVRNIPLKTIWFKTIVFWRKIRVSLLVGALIGLFISTFIVLNRLEALNRASKEEILRQQQSAKTQSEELQRGIQDINNHIDCIIEFYQQPDRGNLVISSIEECRLKRLQSQVDTPNSTPVVSKPRRSSIARTTPKKVEDKNFLGCLPVKVRNDLKKSLSTIPHSLLKNLVC